MDYKKLIESAKALDFVADEATADAVIKSVLGHFASRIQEEKARDFINDLPFPLTFEKLRGHQINTYRIPVEAFIDDMQEQFALTYDQAFTAITTEGASTEPFFIGLSGVFRKCPTGGGTAGLPSPDDVVGSPGLGVAGVLESAS